MANTLSWTRESQSFSQRYGYEEPLPESMQLENLSEEARNAVFNIIYDIVSVQGNWGHEENRPAPRMCRHAIASCLKISIPEVGFSWEDVFDKLKSIVFDSPFNEVLDMLEYLAEYRDDRNFSGAETLNGRLANFPNKINGAFDRYGVAYVFDTSREPFHIWPRTSEAQGVAIQNSVAMLKDQGLVAPVTHLRDAASHLDSMEYADAIADSIHAVESVVRILVPGNPKLGAAIASLQEKDVLKHPALAKAIKCLYGYSSDEEGIRHALVFQDKANVNMNEAMFMFGACASLAAYLANICREEG